MLLTCLIAAGSGLAWATPPAAAQSTFTCVNKTTADGVGTYLSNVYVSGSMVYAASKGFPAFGTQGRLSISTDGGATFTSKTTANGLGNNAVNGVYAVGSTVYAATDNGLSISTDGGATFTNKTTANGLGNNSVRGVYAVGSTVYAATASGLSLSTDGGATFTNKTTANGLGNNSVRGVYASGSTVYAATQGGLSISTDGGASFINKTTTNDIGNNYVYGVYASGSTVYAATQGGLSISTDGGATFTNKTTANGLGNNVVYGVYASGNTVYAATDDGLSISTDDGATFTNYTTANGLGNDWVNGVYASGSTVYAATNSGLSICTLAAPTAPEIAVAGKGVTIANGDSTPDTSDDTAFGTVQVGSTVTHTFTISNGGTAALTLSGSPLVAVSGSSAFSVGSQPADSSVAAGSSATFALTFAPSASGVQTATVTIANNDSDENPYTFVVGGSGTPPIETTVVLDGSGRLTLIDSNGGVSNDTLTLTRNGANLRINDPTNTVGGSGSGVVQVDANTVDVPLTGITGGLTIDTLAGTDTVNLNATLALGAGDLVVTAQTINVNAPVSVSGSANISLTARQQLVVNAGADLTTVDGDLTLNANQGATATSGDYVGLSLQAALIATGTGNITLNGRGGPNGDSNYGVDIANNTSKVQSAGGAITIHGQGGGGSGGWNYGVKLYQSTITNTTGAIQVVGLGGTYGGRNVGLYMDSTVISSTGSGPAIGHVTLQGIGGAPADSDNFGIQMRGSSRINSVDGDLTIIGAGGENSTNNGWGIFIENNGSINSTGTGMDAATITITGTAPAGNGAAGLFLAWGGATINTVDGALTINGIATSSGSDPNSVVFWPARLYSTGSGAITINAASTHATDFVTLASETLIDSGTADLTLRVNTIAMIEGNLRGTGKLLIAPRTAGTSIGIGDGSGTLNVSDGLLGRINDGFSSITIGDANSGPVDINTATFRDPVTIVGSVIRDHSGVDLDAATNPVTLVGAVAPGQSPGILNVTGDVTLATNAIFQVEIGGATPGEGSSNHDQVNATGVVTIANNVALSLTAVNSYSPTAGASYGLINNDGSDGVNGVFSGLPEGATIANFLGSSHNATISYQGGDGNDVVITVNAPEIDVQGNSVSIANGDSTPDSADHTAFGNVTVESSLQRTFTISNSGNADLTDVLVTIDGSACAAGATSCIPAGDFTLVSAPDTTIAAGDSSSFTIEFAPSAAGLVESVVSIASNDSNENPYTFAVNGNGVALTQITIVLDAVPNLPTNLGFQGSLGSFILDDPALDDSDAYTNTKSFTVAPGSYTVRRNNPAGWFTTAIVCTPDGKGVTNVAQRSAAITVAEGDNVTCTFTVERAAVINARAFNDLVRRTTNLGKRNAGDPWLNGQPMTLTTSTTQTLGSGVTAPVGTFSQYSFINLRAGTYTVCTAFPVGWTLTTPTAVDPAYGQPCKPVTLTPGQTATVLFGAYEATVVASEAFTPADERITDEDSIVDRPYDPAEDETATEEAAGLRLFLPLINR